MDRKKITQQLVDEGKMVVHGGHYFPNSPKNPGTGKFSTLRNMKSSENGVIVMGAAKAGNHLVMSILVRGFIKLVFLVFFVNFRNFLKRFLRPRIFDALGIERAEELGVENGITPFPFEFQDRFLIY